MFKFSSKIRILYTNVNSYNPKKHIINHTIENHKINCALFVESKTKPDTDTTYQNWNILRCNGNIVNHNIRGGSLVQVHPNLKMGKANPPQINNPLNNALHFTLPFQDDKLHIFLIYIHPSSNIEENIFTKATQYKYAIIIGDFNINQTKRKQIDNFLKNTEFAKVDTPPTFIMPNNPDSTPDLVLHTSNISNNILGVELLPDIGSDHLSIKIEFDLKKTAVHNEPITKYKYSNCNTDKVNYEIKRFIEDNENKVLSPELISNFNVTLKNSIAANTPKLNTQFYTHELPPFIIQLIKIKRKMYREYKANINQEFKQKINEFNKNIHKMIVQYRTHKWLEACQEINKQRGKNFYQQINKLTKYKNRHSIPTLEQNGSQYEEDAEKVNIFSKQFEKAYKLEHNDNFNDQNYEMVNDWYNEYFNTDYNQEVQQLEEEEYFKALHAQKNTSPGYDNVPWIILKKLDYEIHKFILKIFEYCINNSYFHSDWKKGQIITIPKPNTDHKNPANYRPITLLPVLGKLFEKIIRNRLNELVKEKIPIFQYGFKQKSSTIHPLTILTSNIQTAKHSNLKSAAIFLDIKKAFDCVWHRGLLFKLRSMDIPDYLIHLIKNFLENRRLQIKINNTYSREFTAEQGVPQGSPLSPLLYNIYCHDILTLQEPNKSLYILQYADDTALISHNKNLTITVEKLQTLMDNTQSWFNKWRLQPNPTKSQFMIFNHTPKNSSPTVSITNHLLKPLTSIKYLGIHLDNKLNFNLQTKIIKKRTTSRAKHFRCLTYKNKGINTSIASKIYKTICRPILEYAHVLYLNCRKPALKNIQVAETSTLRTITKMRHPTNSLHNPTNELLYRKTKIQPIQERLTKLSTKFASRIHNLELMQPLLITRDRNHPKYRYPEKTLQEILTSLHEEQQ